MMQRPLATVLARIVDQLLRGIEALSPTRVVASSGHRQEAAVKSTRRPPVHPTRRPEPATQRPLEPPPRDAESDPPPSRDHYMI
jgi:hypothetical protein